jgi:hypothetical protein
VWGSGIDAFQECINAITVGNRDGALRFGQCAKKVVKLSSGSRKMFGYAEVWTRPENIIRVDPFLGEQAQTLIDPHNLSSEPGLYRDWFKGVAHGSFVGEVQAVDLRGALPEVKLILSNVPKEIDCVCREDDIEKIRMALKRRVRLYGQAIYDGRSGLPRRIEVTEIELLDGAVDITKWRGAFQPFEIIPWEGDDL